MEVVLMISIIPRRLKIEWLAYNARMGQSSPRRTLQLPSLDAALTEAQRLMIAERQGKLRCVGAWDLGQTLNHLACWADYAHDGLPIKVPAWIRWIGPLLKNRVLNHAMPPGRKLPGVNGGTLAIDRIPTAEAMPHLERAYARLLNQAPPARHPIFGKFTHEDWIRLNLRHAELHLSFLDSE